MQVNQIIFPSYTQRLLVEHLRQKYNVQGTGEPIAGSFQAFVDALMEIVAGALEAEQVHLLHTVGMLLDRDQERFESTFAERSEVLDTYLEGLSLGDETDTRSPRQLADELSSTLRVSLRLNGEQQRSLREDPESLREEILDQIDAQLTNRAITRLIGSVERRLEESLNLNNNELANEDWDTIYDQVLGAIRETYARRKERYLGKDFRDSDGLIRRDLENALSKVNGNLSTNAVYQLLGLLPQGTRAAFDKKTHRRVYTRTTRFSYTYMAAHLLDNRDPEEVTRDVLEHLEHAMQFLHRTWGAIEFSRIAANRPSELDETTQNGLREVYGEQVYDTLLKTPLQDFNPEQREIALQELGRQALTEIYRQLLLSVITELWVDYLTQMEALRVSIGLEAYAQRDPLVQYKNRAYALFQELLGNMRLNMVNRMFTYRPRDMAAVQTNVQRADTADEEEFAEPTAVTEQVSANQTPEPDQSKGKRRRRRRR